MQHLIIDGHDLGPVTGYRQNRDLMRWSFLMAAGYYVGIDFSNIRLFNSGGEHLKIITFRRG